MFGLPKEIWEQISTDNPTTYYKLLQVSKIFKLDTDIMKAKFIRVVKSDDIIYHILPNGWAYSHNDQPAVILPDSSQFWCIDDIIHRDNDQPAILRTNGKYWYDDEEHHDSDDQIAKLYANGKSYHDINDCYQSTIKSNLLGNKVSQYWYHYGKKHRDNDKPAIIRADGSQFWYINGKQHRDNDLPAEIFACGIQRWYINGKLHRNNDQPAEIWANGARYWYINDEELPSAICL